MFNRVMLCCGAVLMLGILTACGNQPAPVATAPTAAPPPTRAPAPTAATVIAPTEAGTQSPAAAPTASAAQSGDTSAIPNGLTPEGYHMLGRADAPVTLVMYSDFL